MKVAFDVSTAAFKQKTGTGVYVVELTKAYEDLFSKEDKIIHSYRLSRRVRGASYLLPVPSGGHRDTLIDPITRLYGYRYDIFHGLNSRLPLLAHAKKIATIHDLFSIFGQFAKEEFKNDQTKKLNKMIVRADHFITPASYTKKLLEEKFQISKERISVVPLGVRPEFLKEFNRNESQRIVSEELDLRNPYLFFVGALEKRKNVKSIIEAFIKVHKGRNLNLVLAGHPGFGFDEIQKGIDESGCKEKFKIIGFTDSEMLGHLYRACEVFVFPSLEEGYGLPVLEAMACGAPVITSSTTSLPEAANGHAWLVNPHSIEDIASKIEFILKRSSQVLEQIGAAQKYASTMTWKRVAKSTREVYCHVLNAGRS